MNLQTDVDFVGNLTKEILRRIFISQRWKWKVNGKQLYDVKSDLISKVQEDPDRINRLKLSLTTTGCGSKMFSANWNWVGINVVLKNVLKGLLVPRNKVWEQGW